MLQSERMAESEPTAARVSALRHASQFSPGRIARLTRTGRPAAVIADADEPKQIKLKRSASI